MLREILVMRKLQKRLFPVLNEDQNNFLEKIITHLEQFTYAVNQRNKGFITTQLPSLAEFTDAEKEIIETIGSKVNLLGITEQEAYNRFFEEVIPKAPIISELDQLIYPENYN